MQIQFDNRQKKYPVDEIQPLIEQVLATVLEQEAFNQVAKKQGAEPLVQITFVGPAAIRRVNADTRSIDRVTDVLSFPMLDLVDGRLQGKLQAADIDQSSGQKAILLGDILICLERACQQAESYGHSFNREVGFLAAHGCLHLLGYDHDTPSCEQKMQKKQRQALNLLGLTREKGNSND